MVATKSDGQSISNSPVRFFMVLVGSDDPDTVPLINFFGLGCFFGWQNHLFVFLSIRDASCQCECVEAGRDSPALQRRGIRWFSNPGFVVNNQKRKSDLKISYLNCPQPHHCVCVIACWGSAGSGLCGLYTIFQLFCAVHTVNRSTFASKCAWFFFLLSHLFF